MLNQKKLEHKQFWEVEITFRRGLASLATGRPNFIALHSLLSHLPPKIKQYLTHFELQNSC